MAVEKQLKASNRALPLSAIDTDALRTSFESGESPVVFAKRDSIPLRSTGQSAIRVKRPLTWLVFPIALIPLAVTYRYLHIRLSEEHGWDALTRRRSWPVNLPLTTATVKGFVPAEAIQIRPEVEQFVRTKLLNPSSAQFLDIEPIAIDRPGTYVFEGKVEAVNQYGTRVVSGFLVTANRPVRVNHGQPGQKSTWTVVDEEWKFVARELGRTMESSIWSEDASNGMVAPTPKKKAPSKRFSQ